MIVLDFLFKICFAPFAVYNEKGKMIASFTLSPSLSFLLLGGINILLYLLKPIVDIRLSPLADALIMIGLVIGITYLLERIYVKKGRSIGRAYHPLSGLLILVFIFGSIIIYAMTLKYT